MRAAVRTAQRSRAAQRTGVFARCLNSLHRLHAKGNERRSESRQVSRKFVSGRPETLCRSRRSSAMERRLSRVQAYSLHGGAGCSESRLGRSRYQVDFLVTRSYGTFSNALRFSGDAKLNFNKIDGKIDRRSFSGIYEIVSGMPRCESAYTCFVNSIIIL